MRPHWIFPAIALAVLIASGLLVGRIRPIGGEPTPPPEVEPPSRTVVFPRDRPRLRPEGRAGPSAPDQPPPAPGSPRPLDRFERAVAVPGAAAVVAEVNAIRHSPLAAAIFRCQAEELEEARASLLDATGIDLLEDVDRVMVVDGGVVVSGFFSGFRVPEELGPPRPYGDAGRIYAGDDAEQVLAQVGSDLLAVFDDPAEAEAAIDRIEERAPAELPPRLLEGGGELFGPLGPDALAQLFGEGPLAPILELVETAAVRVAVDDHVAVSLDLEGATSASAPKLAALVRGGLAGLRVKAAQDGRPDLVELLRQARVNPANGSLAVDFAVPGEIILAGMGCDATGRRLE